MGKADLHIHTTASDGKSEPGEIVEAALKYGLEIIALTDHDTIKGFKEARKAAKGTNLKIISGIEITSGFNGKEAHILAYCFDIKAPVMRELIYSHKKARLKRGKWILEQLKDQGLSIDIEEVKAEANGSNIGRPHIASVLVDKGYVASSKEAFIRYLSNQALGTIEQEYYSAQDVIERVKKAGGAAVLAHPGRIYNKKELEHFVTLGIDGIEVLHPSHYYELQKEMEAFGKEHDLLMTGGSDFHGGNRDYQKYFGVITVSTQIVHKMIRMTEQRSKISI